MLKISTFTISHLLCGPSRRALFGVFYLFSIEPELDTEIDPGMVMTPLPSSILDETRFEPTTY